MARAIRADTPRDMECCCGFSGGAWASESYAVACRVYQRPMQRNPNTVFHCLLVVPVARQLGRVGLKVRTL